MLSAVTGLDVTNAPFDKNTLDLLDQNSNFFSAVNVVDMARILKLDLDNTAEVAATGQPAAPGFPLHPRDSF